jgi:protein-L-isoaspartate(D-aspartate) O-methyltransferase
MEKAESRNGRMVDWLVAEGYIKTGRVEDAFRSVVRELFVPEDMRLHAYDDRALPIGHGQTISQPAMVAIMTEVLGAGKSDVVLEIGGGSGYQAAILSKLARKVYSMEIEPELAEAARKNLKRAGISNVEVMVGDGSLGYAKAEPYVRIIISCACDEVPKALFNQLKADGVLIAPVGGAWLQELMSYRKTKSGIREGRHGGCAFVQLRGAAK